MAVAFYYYFYMAVQETAGNAFPISNTTILCPPKFVQPSAIKTRLSLREPKKSHHEARQECGQAEGMRKKDGQKRASDVVTTKVCAHGSGSIIINY